jgi:hypothetical protein
MGSVAKSYVRKGFLIYEEMRKYLTKYEEEAVSYMTLQLLHSEFPYIWGRFDFLFYQCGSDYQKKIWMHFPKQSEAYYNSSPDLWRLTIWGGVHRVNCTPTVTYELVILAPFHSISWCYNENLCFFLRWYIFPRVRLIFSNIYKPFSAFCTKW